MSIIRMSDPYKESRESTARITALNQERLYWTRIEWASNALIQEYYGKDETERGVCNMLTKLINTARARIDKLDERLTIESERHEQIMQKILDLP